MTIRHSDLINIGFLAMSGVVDWGTDLYMNRVFTLTVKQWNSVWAGVDQCKWAFSSSRGSVHRGDFGKRCLHARCGGFEAVRQRAGNEEIEVMYSKC